MISRTGNSSGAGRPPAKEMTSGFSANFRISRISDAFKWFIRLAVFSSMRVISLCIPNYASYEGDYIIKQEICIVYNMHSKDDNYPAS